MLTYRDALPALRRSPIQLLAGPNIVPMKLLWNSQSFNELADCVCVLTMLQIKQETDEFVHEREQKTHDLELRQRREI